MDAGVVVAITACSITVAVAVAGFIERRFAAKNAKIDLLEQTIKHQDATIQDLRSQKDKLEVTGEFLDRFLSVLPPPSKRKGDT